MNALAAVMLATLAAAGLGMPAGLTPADEEIQAQRLLHELQVRRTIGRLQLSDAQKWALLPLVKAQAEDEAAIQSAQQRALPQVEPAMLKLRQAVLANQGVSDEIKKRVRAAEAPYKQPKRALEQVERERIQQVWQMLTTSQGLALRGQKAPAKNKQLQQLAQRLRKAQDPDELLRRFYRQLGLRGAEVERAVAHGRAVLARSEKQPGNARPAALVRALRALPETGVLAPKPGRPLERKLKRLLLSDATLRVLAPGAPLIAKFEPPASLRSATTDVQVMNLVNTLYLSPDQSYAIARLGRSANDQLATLLARRQELARRSLPMLRRVRDDLAFGRGLAPEPKAELQSFQKGRQALMAEQQAVVSAHLEQVRGLLNENQLEMIATFVPCTVPVQSLTNPERVGQVSDSSGIERALERLRKVPQARVDKAAAKLKKRVQERFRHKRRPDAEIAKVVKDVDAVVAETRAMDDAQFEVRKADLARRLVVPDARAEGKALDKRIVRYLLSPNLAPILEQRIAGR
ncbi:MAG: hypothetical protein ACOX6T_15475 [Myxococcales bacterium]|jgi:hypothetical protein